MYATARGAHAILDYAVRDMQLTRRGLVRREINALGGKIVNLALFYPHCPRIINLYTGKPGSQSIESEPSEHYEGVSGRADDDAVRAGHKNTGYAACLNRNGLGYGNRAESTRIKHVDLAARSGL
jgi:hypothetical protein